MMIFVKPIADDEDCGTVHKGVNKLVIGRDAFTLITDGYQRSFDRNVYEFKKVKKMR